MQLISDTTLRDIEKSLGLDFLNTENKNGVMTGIIELICTRAGIRIMKGFNAEQTAEFNLIPEKDLEAMEDFILANSPEARAIFEEEAQRAKAEGLSAKIEPAATDDSKA